jgi:hypothetical protein
MSSTSETAAFVLQRAIGSDPEPLRDGGSHNAMMLSRKVIQRKPEPMRLRNAPRWRDRPRVGPRQMIRHPD